MADEEARSDHLPSDVLERQPRQNAFRRVADVVSCWFSRDGQLHLDTSVSPQPLAHIRPLDDSYSGRKRWDGTFLKTLWTINLTFLSLLALSLLVNIISSNGYRRTPWTQLFIIGLTVVTECVEVLLYSRRDLRRNRADSLIPAVFLALQVLKCLVWTWNESWAFRVLRAWLAQPTRYPMLQAFYLFVGFGILLSRYATLSYAVFIFIRESKLQRTSIRAATFNSETILADDQYTGVGRASFTVNQACDLQHDTPLLGRQLMWLDKTDQPGSPWSYLIYCIKYPVVALSSVFLFTVSERLPGEPRTKIALGMQSEMSFNHYNYPKPIIPSHTIYSDEVESQDVIDHIPAESTPKLRPSASATSLHPVSDVASASARRTPSPRLGQSRPLGPRYLCFLDEHQPRGFKTLSYTEWPDRRSSAIDSSYVFISYTRRQFYSQIRNDPSLTSDDIAAHQASIQRDQAYLIEFALKTVKEAEVSAFWIDFECVLPEEGESALESIEEVYRICDIVRAAHSIAIILAPPLDENFEHDTDPGMSAKDDWLRDWGRRLWTVPEALLAPSEHRIMVYALGTAQPEMIAKRNFASLAYDDDAESMQQLIDHYEGSVPLTPLQFISLALECLQRRQTMKRMAGDVSYALQGLLRLRPTVHKSDSDFQAFARLSLANDSDRLLERLICLQPTDRNAPWHDMSDVWGARIWNIVPICEVAGVLDEYVVRLAAVPCASIDWSRLENVHYEGSKGKNLKKWQWLRSSSPSTVLFGIFFLLLRVLMRDELDHFGLGFWVPMGIIWLMPFVTCLASPAWILRLLNCKIRSSEARFFGIQGIPDLAEVERRIFGSTHGRMKWASRAAPAASTVDGELLSFTLVDTMTLTAVVFSAQQPPAVVVACGREKGMARALLCSYNWSRRTFMRETTIRMESTVLERMNHVDEFPLEVA